MGEEPVPGGWVKKEERLPVVEAEVQGVSTTSTIFLGYG